MGRRVAGLDVLRGVGIIAVVFMHSALFQYKNIMDIDFANPPLVVTLMGFLLMWAGLFAIISMMANTSIQVVRVKQDRGYNVLRALTISGLFLFLMSIVYFMFLGPPLLDLERGQHQYSLIHGLLQGSPSSLHIDRFFYVNALTMLGMNLLLLAPVLNWLLKLKRTCTHYLMLMGGAVGVLLLSLLRLPLYPIYQEIYHSGKYLMAFFLGLLVNKNNPILPFLAFGLLGVALALWLFESPTPKRNIKYVAAIGVLFLVVAIVGLVFLPSTMLERDIDMFWYYLMVMQFGLFSLLTLGAVAFFDLAPMPKRATRAKATSCLRRFGMVSLSVFLLETPLGQITARVWDVIYPNWSQSMNVTFLYAAVNVVLWAAILILWQRKDFKFSAEWMTAQAYALVGRRTAKTQIREHLNPEKRRKKSLFK